MKNRFANEKEINTIISNIVKTTNYMTKNIFKEDLTSDQEIDIYLDWKKSLKFMVVSNIEEIKIYTAFFIFGEERYLYQFEMDKDSKIKEIVILEQ